MENLQIVIKNYYLNNIAITNVELYSLKSILENILFSNNTYNQIITFNTDFFRITYSDNNFYEICNKSELVVADGMGIVLMILLKYRRKISRITGTELFESCFEIANEYDLRIGLIGASENTLTKLSKKISYKWPLVKIKTISPKFEFEQETSINNFVLQELRDFRPNILMVALGCPRQEKWIYSNKDYIGAKINIGVGAVFDFYAGTKTRAPFIFQRIGLEWFWRMISEPIRLGKRYLLLDIPFFFRTIFKLLLKRGDI